MFLIVLESLFSVFDDLLMTELLIFTWNELKSRKQDCPNQGHPQTLIANQNEGMKFWIHEHDFLL
jgi:hypothetical protein